jgi:hypothetical protein
MTLITISYLVYVTISIALTIWVARTLHRNGRVFLVDAFHGNENMADSVNHLLVVGFYLINVGFVVLALKYGDKPTDVQTAIEFLSTKVGLVLVVLGGMHFFNMFNFDKMRRKARRSEGSDATPNGPRERVDVATDAAPFQRA